MTRSKTVSPFAALIFAALLCSCQTNIAGGQMQNQPIRATPSPVAAETTEIDSDEIKKLLASAAEQTRVTKSYDPAYVVLPYPNGDVPIETGVCSDVVVRAFRRAGLDLQKEIHEDMRRNFAAYPKKWSLKAPDANIDHRRVPNLQTFFARRGKSLPVTNEAENYQPGDVVAWHLDNRGTTHIGIVSNLRNDNDARFLIIHNIGGGTRAEDVLFDWKIIGHYRYF